MDLKHVIEERDLLSCLPDEILLHILYFLPIKDAAKTAFIRRFGSLWRGITILDLDQCSYHSCHNGPYFNQPFINLIDQVVQKNGSIKLEKLRLKFHFHKGYDHVVWEDCGSKINSLVHYALSKNVKVLDLDLLGCGFPELIEEDYIVPDAVFTSDCLEELRLAFCEVRLINGEVSLKSLKVLFLEGLELDDEFIEKVLHGCASLQDLSMIGCSSLTKLNCNANFKLERLSLVLYKGNTLTISCPHVLSLEITGCVDRVRLILQ